MILDIQLTSTLYKTDIVGSILKGLAKFEIFYLEAILEFREIGFLARDSSFSVRVRA